MSVLLRPDFPGQAPVRAQEAGRDVIEAALRELGNELFVYRAKVFTALARLNENVPIGRLSPAAIDASLTAWFHDEIEARLNELASEAEDGWQ